MSTAMGDAVKPVYEFTWGGWSRRTDDLKHAAALGAAGVEHLADLGRADPECAVELVGYET